MASLLLPLTPSQSRVLAAIKKRQKHLSTVTPSLSVTWIALDAEVCEKTARKHIATLRRAGYIACLRDRAGVSYRFKVLDPC